jgi:glycosyltransferase involved in cell wall biosynthesis
MSRRVVHLTSVHYAFDTRIFHKECRSLALAGYDVTLIAPHAGGNQSQNGVTLRAIKPPLDRRERMTSTICAVYQAAVQENADIYHFHDPELMPIAALLKARGKRVIYDVHENYSGTMKDKWIPGPLCGPASVAVGVCEATFARACDRIVAATPAIAKKFPPSRTRLVQNYPWLHELTSPNPVPYEQREPIAVYVGWLCDERGVGTMIRAVELAAKESPVKLQIAGKVVSGAKLQFDDGRSRDLVEHLGFLNRPQVAELIAQARVGLITPPPTGNSVTAQPTKLFEYMSGGLPVLASDFPVYRSIVESAGCGLLVNPLDPAAIAAALVWILRHPSEAAEMGRSGQRAVTERYNWEHEAKSLIRTYAEL